MKGVVERPTLVCQVSRYRIWVEPPARGSKSKLILEVFSGQETEKPRRLPFDANYFDIVILDQSYPLQTPVLAESLRVLKEGGQFFWRKLGKNKIPRGAQILLHSGMMGVGQVKENLLGQEREEVLRASKPMQIGRH